MNKIRAVLLPKGFVVRSSPRRSGDEPGPPGGMGHSVTEGYATAPRLFSEDAYLTEPWQSNKNYFKLILPWQNSTLPRK